MSIFSHASEGVQDILAYLAIIGFIFLTKITFSVIIDFTVGFKTYVLPMISNKKDDFVNMYGKWAIVTGCTQGIGKSYVEELASRGMNLVLISRNQSKLEYLEKQIKSNYKGVKCILIAQDFTNPSALPSTIKYIESHNLDIGILVNNVGVLGPHWMPFLELKESQVKDIISVNVISGTILCHAILPIMIRKGKGAIINISSTCSAFSVPYLATYAATKHFITAFNNAIAAEYKHSGVKFQLVEPGQVDTKMTELFANKLSWSVPSPSTFVKSAIKRIEFSSHTCGYWPHSFQSWFMDRAFPQWLVSRLMLKEGENQYKHAIKVLNESEI